MENLKQNPHLKLVQNVVPIEEALEIKALESLGGMFDYALKYPDRASSLIYKLTRSDVPFPDSYAVVFLMGLIQGTVASRHAASVPTETLLNCLKNAHSNILSLRTKDYIGNDRCFARSPF